MTITEYEQKIRSLNNTEFEELIHELVASEYDKGNNNFHINNNFQINHTGKVIGKQASKKGTPDIWFSVLNDNRVVNCFVEITSQESDLFGEKGKINSDLRKCKDKIESENLKVDKIIYAFTSSIMPEQEKKYVEFCASFGCEFVCWSIHTIISILRNYPQLVSEYLKITIGHGDLVLLSEAKKRNKLGVVETNKFLYREQDKKTLAEKLLINKAIILYGPSGCGKSRLAIEVASELEKNNFTAYWLRPADAEVFDEIKSIVSKKDKKVIIIDDANRFPYISSILHCIEQFNDIYVILTIRDYAYKSFAEKIKEAGLSSMSLMPLSNDNIKEIIKQEFNIYNQDGLEYITNVAKGNLRFAIMTAEVLTQQSKKAQTVAEVLEYYYEGTYDELNLSEYSNMDNFLVAISFFKNILIDGNDEFIYDICKAFDIDADRFNEYCVIADKKELINYNFDKRIVEISDQILADYLCYKIIILERRVKLVNIFKQFYSRNKRKVIDLIQSLLNIYADNVLLKQELKEIDDYVLNTLNYETAVEFYRVFGNIFPESAIQIAEKILLEYDGDKIKYEVYDNSVYSESIRLLCAFHEYKEYSDSVIDIILQLITDKSILNEMILGNIQQYFKVSKESFTNRYSTQIKLMTDSIEIYKETGEHCDLLMTLFQMYYPYISEFAEYRRSEMAFYKIRYIVIPEYKVLRKLFWDMVSILLDKDLYENLTEIFYKNAFISGEDYELRCIDKEYVLQLLNKVSDETMSGKVLKFAMISPYRKMDEIKPIIKEMTSTKCMSMFADYVCEVTSKKVYGEAFNKAVKQDIELYENVYELINDLSLLESVASHHRSWVVSEIINLSFDCIYEKNNEQYDYFVLEFLKRNPRTNCQPLTIIKRIKDKKKLLAILKRSDAKCSQTWIAQLFLSLETCEINNSFYNEAEIFFTDEKFFNNIHWGNEKLFNLQNFEHYKKGFLHFVLQYYFKNHKETTHFVDTLFSGYVSEYELLDMFDGDIDLLAKVYLYLLGKNVTVDYNGKFAKFLISKDKTYLYEILDCLLSNNNDYFNIKTLYELDGFAEVFLEYILKEGLLKKFRVSEMLKVLPDSLYEQLIEKYIVISKENETALFNLTIIIKDKDCKGQLFMLDCMIRNDVAVSILERLPIMKGPNMWSGSIIPYLKNNLNALSGYIDQNKQYQRKYRTYLCKLKNQLQDLIRNAEITEYSEDKFGN